MKPIYVFLTTGFEEIEALGTIDVLRRGELNVKVVSLTGDKQVTGSHNIPVIADVLFEDIDPLQAQMLVIPGGTPHYIEHKPFSEAILAFAQKGGKVAAICASPMVLGTLGLLRGKNATCYPGFEKYLEGANLQTDKAVVVDGNIITGRGPGLTIDFALQLVEILAGKAKRDEVAKGILV